LAEQKLYPRTVHEDPKGSTLPLTSALDGVGGQLDASAALSPGKRKGTHFIGGYVGPEPVWKGAGNLASHQDSILGHPST